MNVWGDSVGCGVVAHLSELSPSAIKNQLLCCCGKKQNHVQDGRVDISHQNKAFNEDEDDKSSKAETDF